ncbi:hypothetical protein [Ruegeria hyattellae]|uniref:hypothetical protein n=1 Tax=Ruegeria hyattellae TaxID=3233337 RepID=UPI00355BB7DA
MFDAGKSQVDAGVPMNEGAVATAVVVHLTFALYATHEELCGTMNLRDNSVRNPTYSDGIVHVPDKPGIGVVLSMIGLNISD